MRDLHDSRVYFIRGAGLIDDGVWRRLEREDRKDIDDRYNVDRYPRVDASDDVVDHRLHAGPTTMHGGVNRESLQEALERFGLLSADTEPAAAEPDYHRPASGLM